jgi:hypothetical protein
LKLHEGRDLSSFAEGLLEGMAYQSGEVRKVRLKDAKRNGPNPKPDHFSALPRESAAIYQHSVDRLCTADTMFTNSGKRSER